MLKVADVDEPHAGHGQVRVTVRAVGVNGLDWKIHSGGAPFRIELPYIGGLEVSRVVSGPRVDPTNQSEWLQRVAPAS